MIHKVKFAISAAFMVLGLAAFLALPFWTGIAAMLAITLLGHGLAVLIFKRFATKEERKRDLAARSQSDWDMNG